MKTAQSFGHCPASPFRLCFIYQYSFDGILKWSRRSDSVQIQSGSVVYGLAAVTKNLLGLPAELSSIYRIWGNPIASNTFTSTPAQERVPAL